MVQATGLYIFWFLHQTTTLAVPWLATDSCISFDSYIKPQRNSFSCFFLRVVYLLIPTSNHNISSKGLFPKFVVYLLIPTSNHNVNAEFILNSKLYIFWFLHQTTTLPSLQTHLSSCISFDSYIKPQQQIVHYQQTSVVYLLIPTSNHNNSWHLKGNAALYIFWFLHQTTTNIEEHTILLRCISFDSYIKPQHCLNSSPTTPSCISFDSYIKPQLEGMLRLLAVGCISFDSYIKPQQIEAHFGVRPVVYLLIPTSNHNLLDTSTVSAVLYIFWFLHQTTTSKQEHCAWMVLYIFWFLHQTTTD